jgi:hypothetical protein
LKNILPEDGTSKYCGYGHATLLASLLPASKTNLFMYLYSDDVYEHMVFDNNKMIRLATLPDMWERTITIGELSYQFLKKFFKQKQSKFRF